MTDGDERKTRKRNSYANWKNWYKFLQEAKPEDILWKIHGEIDGRRGYKSQYNSACSEESLTHLLKDREVEKYRQE